MSTSYAQRAKELLPELIDGLKRAKLKGEALEFGGAEDPEARIYVPTHADSKFVAEQALGDWAEDRIAQAIRTAKKRFTPVHYGTSSKKMAGDDGFTEEFREGVVETRLYGKRPDLLILPEEVECEPDVSEKPILELEDLTTKSVASIEVRSSRLEAQTYIAYRKSQIEEGKRVTNPEPSITVKIEDLQKVYRWIERYNVPQIYCQVFFDQVNSINVLEIMSYIGSAEKLRVENPARSRKATIMIPISEARLVGRIAQEPEFEVDQQTTLTGRRVIYARPVGGEIQLDWDELEKSFFF